MRRRRGRSIGARRAAAGLAGTGLPLIAAGADKALIDDVRVFDEFVGGSLGAGKKSLAITVRLQPVEKTLTDEEIEELLGLDEEVGEPPGVEHRLALRTGGEQLPAPSIEAAVQVGDKIQRPCGQDLVETGAQGREDMDGTLIG